MGTMNRNEQQIEAILLDLDGVVFLNTTAEKQCDRIYQFINAKAPISYETVRAIVALANSFDTQNNLIFFFSALGLEDYIPEFVHETNIFEEPTKTVASIPTSFHAFLDHCQRRDVKVYTFSLCKKKRVMDALSGFPQEHILNVDGIAKNPAAYKKAVQKLGVEAKHCLVIDDDPFAIRCAHLAGCKTAWYVDPFFEAQAGHYEWCIDHQIKDLAEIEKILSG